MFIVWGTIYFSPELLHSRRPKLLLVSYMFFFFPSTHSWEQITLSDNEQMLDRFFWFEKSSNHPTLRRASRRLEALPAAGDSKASLSIKDQKWQLLKETRTTSLHTFTCWAQSDPNSDEQPVRQTPKSLMITCCFLGSVRTIIKLLTLQFWQHFFFLGALCHNQ